MTKQISVISWDDALKLLPKKNPNQRFCDFVSKMCSDFKEKKNDYVYHIQFEFGEKLIDKGAIVSFESCSMQNKMKGVTKTLNDFKNDLNYTCDPLGMVVKNHIEVYSENDILKSGSKIKGYRVHLNTIGEGGLFGVFGTLDYLIDDPSANTSDWYALAGNSCFEILFPFENDTVFQEITKHLNVNAKFINKRISSDVEEKVRFFKSYIEICNKKWRTDVIYFPKHYVSCENLDFITNLFKTGWNQSKISRNFLFENKTLTDIIYSLDNEVSFQHNKHFLNLILDYLIKASNGEAYILKPLKDEKHILNIALSEFKKDISTFLAKNKNPVPIILHYDKIINKDWGCLSVDSIPILLNYPQINLNNLESDLGEIKQRATKIKFPDFYTTADKGSGKDRCIGRNTFECRIKKSLNLKEGKLSLTTRWLSNFIVINDRI